MIEALGWLSSAILVLTISRQVYRQWQAGTSEGVSIWLFIGNFAASIGLLAYSIAIRNWVFVATNGVLAIEAVLGLVIVCIHRKREARDERPSVTRLRSEATLGGPGPARGG